MSTHNKETAERAKFEKAFSDIYEPHEFERDANGFYKNPSLHDGFVGWLARSALTASEAPATEQAPPLPKHHGYSGPHAVYYEWDVRRYAEQYAAWKIAALRPEQAPAGEVPSAQTAELPNGHIIFINYGDQPDDVAEPAQAVAFWTQTPTHPRIMYWRDKVNDWSGMQAELISRGYELNFLYATPPAVPQGWKLVPVEPTIIMQGAAHSSLLTGFQHMGYDVLRSIYRAMLSAAPAAPQGEQTK